MISLKKRSQGFTIVELLIVIVVIGILATLVIVTFTGIQQKARNSQRQTDINALDSHIEAYYAQTGSYPSFTVLTSSGWIAANMKGLDPEALVDPKGGSLKSGASAADQYGYDAKAGGAACTDTGSGTTATSNCDSFTLTATLEGGGTYTKSSN
jgi:prepilin-type N-terminal cleavage/methylation domain-containing protein